MMFREPPRPPTGPSVDLPPVDIIVAVFNEARTITGKIANLLALDYPGDRLRFIVVDGGSSDDTCEHVAAWAARDDRVSFRATDVAHKTRQLNVALRESRAEWVLVTDSDARMSPNALQEMVREGLARHDVTVVGTRAEPRRGCALEVAHWRMSNWVRQCENRCGTTGLVIATAYLFRRTLLDRFPSDCLADDVYAACQAAATATRVALADVTVEEIRAPLSLRQYTHQKVRRTLAYLREVLRFLPSVVQMARPMREVFAWRAVALLGAPILGLALGGISVSVLFHSTSPQVMTGVLVLLVAGSVGVWRKAKGGAILVLLPVVTVVVLTMALLSYPFVRQVACHERALAGC